MTCQRPCLASKQSHAPRWSQRKARQETPAPDGLGPNAYRAANAGGPSLRPINDGHGTRAGRGADGAPEDKAGCQHASTSVTMAMSACQDVSHKTKLAMLAEVAREKAEASKLGMDLTAHECVICLGPAWLRHLPASQGTPGTSLAKTPACLPGSPSSLPRNQIYPLSRHSTRRSPATSSK